MRHAHLLLSLLLSRVYLLLIGSQCLSRKIGEDENAPPPKSGGSCGTNSGACGTRLYPAPLGSLSSLFILVGRLGERLAGSLLCRSCLRGTGNCFDDLGEKA